MRRSAVTSRRRSRVTTVRSPVFLNHSVLLLFVYLVYNMLSDSRCLLLHRRSWWSMRGFASAGGWDHWHWDWRWHWFTDTCQCHVSVMWVFVILVIPILGSGRLNFKIYMYIIVHCRTSVSGQRSFAVLRSTCSWRVTTYVGKSSAIGQPTRPTQPFILSGSINE